MPTFRFFLCNDDGYVVRVVRRFCADEEEARFFARLALAQAEAQIRSVELWDDAKALLRLGPDDCGDNT